MYSLENYNEPLNRELKEVITRALKAKELVDDVVLKRFLTRIPSFDVIPFPGDNSSKGDLRIFKVRRMVYEKDEYATDKFISMVGSMAYATNTIFLIVDGKEDRTDFYLGVKRSKDDALHTGKSTGDTLSNAFSGQFPGADFVSISANCPKELVGEQSALFQKMKTANTVSSCVGLPALKSEKRDYTNANYIQGIEKLAIAMQGQIYTAIIIATNVPPEEIAKVKDGYENIYTELSSSSNQRISYSTDESLGSVLAKCIGEAEDCINSETTRTELMAHERVIQKKEKSSLDSSNKAGRILTALSSPLTAVGSVLTETGAAPKAGFLTLGAGAAMAVGGSILASGEKKEETLEKVQGFTLRRGKEQGTGIDLKDFYIDTKGDISFVRSSKDFSIKIQNKHTIDTLTRIEKQLDRIEKSESLGLWNSSAYFLSYGNDNSSAEMAAAIYRSIIQGEQSGVEASAINTWHSNQSELKLRRIKEYLMALSHPLFKYTDQNNSGQNEIILSSSSLVNSMELAMMIGLPRKSIPGLPVIDHISLAKEVIPLSRKNSEYTFERNKECTIKLGKVYDQGMEKEQRVELDIKSLTRNVFITGAAGSGKSETVHALLELLRAKKPNIPFLVIEPTKGEYKNVWKNALVYGTNPKRFQHLLTINPFKFCDEIHVLEHVDRMVEVFNACWSLFGAMPSVLKEAILKTYEGCGWDLSSSVNKNIVPRFPTFEDLQTELLNDINRLDYLGKMKGFLTAKVKSLTNGQCGLIFSHDEIGDQSLFDKNTIVDLSRVGSQETTALIMGILLLRLNEYRASKADGVDGDLHHLTVVEEAHRLLKKCSGEQGIEGGNAEAKAVEMIADSISEMRSSGEGFIIVDPSPSAVDISAIRNTHTKIVLRLSDENDRRICGKAMAMKDEQLDEMAILPPCVGVVYQNDWESPVLCKIRDRQDKSLEE